MGIDIPDLLRKAAAAALQINRIAPLEWRRFWTPAALHRFRAIPGTADLQMSDNSEMHPQIPRRTKFGLLFVSRLARFKPS